MTPTVSIIVPVYDAGAYLEQCLGSLLAQSWRQLEILLVDDGSADDSVRICRRHAAADSRVVLMSTGGRGRGPSVARNMALERMTGEYFCFVDADDVVAPRGVERLMALLRDNPQAQIAMAPHVTFSGGEPSFGSTGRERVTVIAGREATAMMLHQTGASRGLIPSPWGKLFRSALRARLHFPEGTIYEDLAALPRLVAGLGSVVTTTLPLYAYRVSPASLLGRFTPERLQVIDVALGLRRFFAADPVLLRAADDRLFAAAFNMWLHLRSHGREHAAALRRCERLMRVMRRRILLTTTVRLRDRAGAIATWFPGLRFLGTMLRLYPRLLGKLLERR